MKKKVSATFSISEDTHQACKNAVAFLAGYPVHLNLSRLAEEALQEKIASLQSEYNKGQPFPYYDGPNLTGRPSKK